MTTMARTSNSNIDEISEMETSPQSPLQIKRNNRQILDNVSKSPSTQSPPKKKGKGSCQESEEINNLEIEGTDIGIELGGEFLQPKKTASPNRIKGISRLTRRSKRNEDRNPYAALDNERIGKKDE